MTKELYKLSDKVRKYKLARYHRDKHKARIAKLRWRTENPEKFSAQKKRYYPKKLIAGRRQHKNWREQAAGRPRPDICEIPGCGREGVICFDHCHNTGAFRGWICRYCNSALGMVKDNPELLRKLADYLEQHR